MGSQNLNFQFRVPIVKEKGWRQIIFDILLCPRYLLENFSKSTKIWHKKIWKLTFVPTYILRSATPNSVNPKIGFRVHVCIPSLNTSYTCFERANLELKKHLVQNALKILHRQKNEHFFTTNRGNERKIVIAPRNSVPFFRTAITTKMK